MKEQKVLFSAMIDPEPLVIFAKIAKQNGYEVVCNMDDNGMMWHVIDASHTSACCMEITSDDMEMGDGTVDPKSFGLDVEIFAKYLLRLKKAKALTFQVRDTDIKVSAERKFFVQRAYVPNVEPKIPKVELDVSFNVPVGELLELIEDGQVADDRVKINVSGSNVTFNSKGESTQCTLFGSMIQATNHNDEKIDTMFDSTYMTRFLKQLPKKDSLRQVNEVNVAVKQDYPLRLIYGTEAGPEIKLWIAPMRGD